MPLSRFKSDPYPAASIKQERPPIFHRPTLDVERRVAVARDALPPVHLPGWGAVERALEVACGVGCVRIIAVSAVGAVAEGVSVAARFDGLVGDQVVEIPSKARVRGKVDRAASLALITASASLGSVAFQVAKTPTIMSIPMRP